MLISETFAAALPLTRFRGIARVPEKRARVSSSARVPVVAQLPIHFINQAALSYLSCLIVCVTFKVLL